MYERSSERNRQLHRYYSKSRRKPEHEAWQGEARATLSLAARVCTHARGSWLPRAAVWPCRARGTGIMGPRHDAAAKRATAVVGSTSGAMGSCTRGGTAAKWERGSYGRATEGSTASPAARG
jgi:hypothetical protein